VSFRSLNAFDVKANWPQSWGSSGTLVIALDRNVTGTDGVEYPKTQNEGSVLRNLGLHFESAITAVNGVATCAAIANLPTTDTATPVNTAHYNIYIYDAKGKMREKLSRAPFHLHESVNGDAVTFTWQQWVVAQQFKQGSSQLPMIGDRATMQAMLDAFLTPHAALATRGWAYLTRDPASASLPYAVGNNDYRMAPSTGGRSLVANQFAGADLGAKINAAFAALAPDYGEVHVYGGGSIATYVTVPARCTLTLHHGVYTCDAPFVTVPEQLQAELGLIRFSDYSIVRGDGWGTIIDQGLYINHPTVFAPYISSVLTSGGYFHGVTRGVRIRDLQIRGRVETASNGTYSTIELGNSHDFIVEGIFLNGTSGNGITAGGSSSISVLNGGDEGVVGPECANGGEFRHNYLFQVQNQGINVVNGQNIKIVGNLIKDHNKYNGSNGAGIDIESNTVTDTIKSILIEGNLLDFRSSPQPFAGNGIVVQSSGQANYGPVEIKHNTLIAENLSNSVVGRMVYGIVVNPNTKNVTVSDNTIQKTSNNAITAYGTQHVIQNNHIISCGDTGPTAAITLQCTKGVISHNKVRIDATATVGSSKIEEVGAADSNLFQDNIADTEPILIGASSKSVGNTTWAGSRSLTIGNGTTLTKVVVYTPSLTPSSIAANTSAEQTFTVAGLSTSDTIYINPPSLTAGTGIVGVRVSATDTLKISFANFTGGSLTPPSGTYRIVAIRS
jgi:hypothetical protein